jgi:spore maturation protein CgeB
MKLFSVSSVYQGSLDQFYSRNPGADELKYKPHLEKFLSGTTEFVASYTRNFRALKVEAECAVANDDKLQLKWAAENGLNRNDKFSILLGQIRSFNPDVLWLENINAFTKDQILQIRNDVNSIRLIIAYHCAPYTRELLDKLRNADFVITCTPGLKQSFEKEGLKVYLVYHGFDKDLLQRIRNTDGVYSNNLIFSGSLITGGNFHSARINLIESLVKEKIDIALYVTLENSLRITAKQSIYMVAQVLKKLKLGRLTEKFNVFEYGKSPVSKYSAGLLKLNHPPLYGLDMYNLFSSSKIVLNIHIGVAADYAGNMRMFEVTGTGSCLLTDNKKNLIDLFEPGREIIVYDNQEDCIAKVKWLMEHEEERAAIARAGQKKTLEMHTVENRVRSIIEIINKEFERRKVQGRLKEGEN